MKPSLHLKVLILIGYVVVCTMLVLLDQQADGPGPDAPSPAGLIYKQAAVQ
jgi:hypothetical protein